MALYKIFRILNDPDLFSNVPKKEDSIKNSRLKSFKIKNNIQYIKCTANDSIKSNFSPEDYTFYDPIDIEVIIFKHKFLYSIVKLSGKGLMSIGGVKKYIDDQILYSIKDHIKNKIDIAIEFIPFEYNNHHFSKDYWGDNIKAKYGYNSSNKMYIKISSSNFNELFEKYPDLEKYYTNGIIKSIKGISSDLEYNEDNKRYLGNFRFGRNGIFNCTLSNVDIFNNFVIKLIDKGFFEEF